MAKNEIDYTGMLPTEPPEGIYDWLEDIGELKSEGIIYRSAYVINPLTGMKEKMAECKCSACGETFYQEYLSAGGCGRSYAPAPFGFTHSQTNEQLISGDCTLCPECGAEVKLLHIGNMKQGKMVDAAYPMSVHMTDGKLCLIGWCIWKKIMRDATACRGAFMYEAYVFDADKATLLKGYDKNFTQLSFRNNWRQLKRCTDEWGGMDSDLIYPWNADILNGTDFENSKLDIYLSSHSKPYPVTYMRLWQKHKNIENLIVQGASRIVSGMLADRNLYYGGIDWKKNRPSAMLGLNKTEFKTAVNDKWGFEDLKFYLEAREYGARIEEMAECKKVGYSYAELLIKRGCSVTKTARYLEKQKEKYPDTKSMVNVRYIVDYWDMVSAEDLKNSDIKYPQNLVRAHDTALRNKEWKEDKKLIGLFKNRYLELERFCYSSDELEIHPAHSEKEMIVEGEILKHCVAGYAKNHAEGKTAIFFIRRSEEPEAPYYTLEFNEKTMSVVQNRGYQNCERTPEVEEFEEKWLEFVRNVIQEENENDKRNRKSA